MPLTPSKGLSFALLCGMTFFLKTASAETIASPEFKATGLSIEWYEHEFDMDVTGINTTIPGLTNAQLEALKSQLDTINKVRVTSLRLDRQISPHVNIFGSIGNVRNDTTAKFSKLGLNLTDMEVNEKGRAYSLGAEIKRQTGRFIASAQYVHSRIDLDENETIKVHTVVPSLGMQTKIGIISGSLAYQGFEASYSGSVQAPFIGTVPATVETENSERIQLLAGIKSKLGKDLYLSASAGLNGNKQYHVQLNRRF